MRAAVKRKPGDHPGDGVLSPGAVGRGPRVVDAPVSGEVVVADSIVDLADHLLKRREFCRTVSMSKPALICRGSDHLAGQMLDVAEILGFAEFRGGHSGSLASTPLEGHVVIRALKWSFGRGGQLFEALSSAFPRPVRRFGVASRSLSTSGLLVMTPSTP
ncbi:hypothetical protein GCM10023193_61030 [Planotetraspora kaengkrachanensis]|uniref:Uncharacterized protein n=1 Tax=Planotetraspora kaengkrachanensis TaxID=575193 RepID=A0A8J3VA49_9ACTN|nr:hypothetical protein Pka01_56710 [Planotetraspora kaengkrachanensis]